MSSGAWPISMRDVVAARRRIRRYLSPTPLRRYRPLDDQVGNGIRVFVKHENHNPTNAFKVRNGVSALTALSDEQRAGGVVCATRGNHGQGVAWAGAALGVPVTICVPRGNNPEKNEAMIGFGAELVESGEDYDDAAAVAERLVRERGLRLIHATNDLHVLAGAATLSAEILDDEEVDAMVVAVGGGSQAVGALTVSRARRPEVAVHGAQAAAAPTIHDSFHAGKRTIARLDPTIADGLATRDIYAMTFPTLCAGLAGFITVTDAEIAEAIRILLRTTHNLVEGGGAAGLAGLLRLREELAGKSVAIILSGGNIDRATLRRVINEEI